jgi:transposase
LKGDPSWGIFCLGGEPGERVLTVEDWAEIRRLHRAEGMPIKAIARTLGMARNTVRAAVRSEGPPKYERKPAGSAVDAVEPRIRELLAEYPAMPATVIAGRIGWERGLTILKDRVRELRPAYLPPDPASRTAYDPGELAQCDFWFPPVTVPAASGTGRCSGGTCSKAGSSPGIPRMRRWSARPTSSRPTTG